MEWVDSFMEKKASTEAVFVATALAGAWDAALLSFAGAKFGMGVFSVIVAVQVGYFGGKFITSTGVRNQSPKAALAGSLTGAAGTAVLIFNVLAANVNEADVSAPAEEEDNIELRSDAPKFPVSKMMQTMKYEVA